MKRLVIRISVLATVVVLGVIAIAKAQRSVWAPPTPAPVSNAAPMNASVPGAAGGSRQ